MDNRFRLSIIDTTPAYVEEIGEYEDCIEDIVRFCDYEPLDAFRNAKIMTALAKKGEVKLTITIVETEEAYYIDLNTELGWGVYDKGDWTLYRAAKHQCFDMFEN